MFDLSFCLNHLLLKCVWHREFAEEYIASFRALKDAYLARVDWEDRDGLERRTARLLAMLLLARIDGKSPVEYLTAGFGEAPASEGLTALLVRLAKEANVKIYETSRAHSPGGTSMATTLVACAFRYDRMAVGHAGDSRCYLIRGGQASLLTRDHTVAQDQTRIGLLSAKEAVESSTRHVLSRALGTDLFVSIETSDIQVYSGDVVLLCCDGLYNSVEASEMAAIAGHGGDLNASAQRLVDIANQRDGSDNISVQLIRVRSVERVGMYRGRPYKLR